MENVVRTVYGNKLQTARLFGKPYVPDTNTTLNERFQVQSGAVLADGQYPTMAYLGIGNAGHTTVQGSNNMSYIKLYQHQPDDAACFGPMPWVLRHVTNDLSPSERSRYAMRVVQTFNGDNYYAYYLRRLDLSALVVKMQKKQIEDGVTTTTDFVPGPEVLVPTPSELANQGTNVLQGNYLTASALLSLVLSANDCTELLNVASIIYSDENHAIISEFALVTAADKQVGLSDGSNFLEAICAQVATFLGSYHQIKFTRDGLTALLDVGASEADSSTP